MTNGVRTVRTIWRRDVRRIEERNPALKPSRWKLSARHLRPRQVGGGGLCCRSTGRYFGFTLPTKAFSTSGAASTCGTWQVVHWYRAIETVVLSGMK